jgi:hypothetical protein
MKEAALARFVSLANNYTGTFPMVYHEPGHPRGRFLPALSSEILSKTWPTIGCPKDLSIVSWSNYKTPTVLERTCNALGIPITIYGKELDRWEKGDQNKLLLAYNACCSESTKYIMGLDSRDVIILATPHLILDTFATTGLKMLFGCEPLFSHNEVRRGELETFFDNLPGASATPIRYLNSGQWIADREFAKAFFRTAIDLNLTIRREQSWLAYTLLFNKHFLESARLDYECAIFHVNPSRLPRDYISFGCDHSNASRSTLRLKEKRFAKLRRYVVITSTARRLKWNLRDGVAMAILWLRENHPSVYRFVKRIKDTFAS